MTAIVATLGGLVVGALAAAAWAAYRGRRRDRELEETRRRLEAARAARQTFFDLTTHELRSPLSAVLGYQELLRDGAYGELTDDARDATERLGRSARHLLNLLDGVMELSRMRTGDLQPDLEAVDLAVVLSSASEAFRGHAIERGISPSVELPPDLPTVFTDRDRLIRALDLVVTSAVRHPAGEAMTLRVAAQNGEVEVELGPTELEVDPAGDDPAVRLGIRLAAAHGIARLLGGGLDLPTQAGHVRRITLRFVDARRPSDR